MKNSNTHSEQVNLDKLFGKGANKSVALTKREKHGSPVAEVHDDELAMVQQRVEINSQFAHPASTKLVQRHKEIMNRTHKNRLPVRFLGYESIFSGHRVFKDSELETDWILMNIMNDPLFTDLGLKRSKSGTLYVPDKVSNTIGETLKSGVDFDSMFIAHEVPKDTVARNQDIDLKALLPPPPPRIRKRQKFRERSLNNVWSALFSFFKGVSVATVGIGAGAVALAGGGLDPILFGVNYDENIMISGKPVGMWYYITHWRWK